MAIYKVDDYGAYETDIILADLEKRISKVYGEASKEMSSTIEDYFAKFKEKDKKQLERLNAGEITDNEYKQWRLAQMGRGKRYEALRDRLAERMTKANEVATAYINDTTPSIYSLNRNYAAFTIEKVTGNVGFDLWDERTVKRLIEKQPDLMPYYPKKRAIKRGIDLEWGKKQITKQVTSGILQGESIPKIARRLRKNIPTMNRESAIRAARTSVTGAQNAGRMDSYTQAEQMGIELEKEWLATLDSRTREEHRKLDGQTVDNDKPFHIDGYELMYPGDPNSAPEMIYNCRCTMIANIKGISANSGLRRDKYGVLPDMTFAQWENSKRGEGYLQKNQTNIVDESIAVQYNNIISAYVKIDQKSIYEIAKNGGKHKGIYNEAMKKRQSNLEKSFASHTSQVKEHFDKIKNPSSYDVDWGKKDQRAKEGLLHKWQKDMVRNAEQASIEITVWKERFGKNDK